MGEGKPQVAPTHRLALRQGSVLNQTQRQVGGPAEFGDVIYHHHRAKSLQEVGLVNLEQGCHAQCPAHLSKVLW